MYISSKKAADLLYLSERSVRDKAQKREFVSRHVLPPKGRGGKPRVEILLESLPEYAQRNYYNQIGGDSQFVVNTDYTSTIEQKRKGELRAQAVTEHRRYEKEMLKRGMKKGDIRSTFIRQWNIDHSDFQITSKSLYDWQKKSPSGQSEKLVDKRGGYNRGQSLIPEKYMTLFDSLYLQQTEPSIESCFKEVKLQANINGDFIPGIKAFRNHVKNMNTAMVVMAREGRKAFEDKCLPYTERDYSLLHPNQFWVSDHHLWDIFVRVPDNKGGWKLARPWGSYWMDMRTRKVMSSIIRIESPNADIVLCSFGLGVEHFGIPNGVRLDNGKDYKARDLFHSKEHHKDYKARDLSHSEEHYIVSEEDKKRIFSSLATNLQIESTYARPYNAKAKPIERLFNTFEEQLGKKYPSYAGSNAKKRPEDLKDLDIMDVITLEEFIRQHNLYVYEIYNESKHSGHAMDGKSPNQAYAEIPFTIRRTSKEMLYFSLMRVKGQRVIQRNGITFSGIHFYNDDCINYIGQEVTARYDPTKPEILYVFDTNENFLFIAEEIQKQGWALTDEDYKRENQRKKIARQKALNSYTADNVIRSTEAIGERLERQARSMEKAEIAKPKAIEIIRNETIENNVKRRSMSDMERNYEDVIRRNNEKKKIVSERQRELADKFKQKMLDRAYGRQA